MISVVHADVWRRFKAWLTIAGKKTFTADDLYAQGLIPLLPEPHKQTVGTFFQNLARHGFIKDTGLRKPSIRSTNNFRELKVWEVTQTYEF